jgi:broad specificity phosphatase PhoE
MAAINTGGIKNIKNIDLTIDVVRHAESCANYAINNYLDKPPLTPQIEGNSRLPETIKQEQPKSIKQKSVDFLVNPVQTVSDAASVVKGTAFREPNLTFVGMQQAIRLGNKITKEHAKNPYDVIITSGLSRTILTALLALRSIPNIVIYVVPFINEIPNDFDLKGMGPQMQNDAVEPKYLKPKTKFLKDWLEKNWSSNKFEDIEIMTYLNNTRTTLNNYIVDVEKRTPTVNIENIELENKETTLIREFIIKLTNISQQTDKYTLDTIIKLMLENLRVIILYLYTNSKKNIDKNTKEILLQTYKAFENIKNITINTYLRGPPVDFSIYEQFYESHNISKPNLNLFYNEIIPNLQQKFDKKSNLRILMFSHGSLIREMIKPINVMMEDEDTEERIVEEERIIEEERIAEAKRIAEEEKITKEAKNSEETNIAEEDNIVKDAKNAEEEHILKKTNYNDENYPDIYNTEHKLRNTTVIRITKKQYNDPEYQILYHPDFIRTNYENFETRNRDLCRGENIKGIINYKIGAIEDAKRIREIAEKTLQSRQLIDEANQLIKENLTYGNILYSGLTSAVSYSSAAAAAAASAVTQLIPGIRELVYDEDALSVFKSNNYTSDHFTNINQIAGNKTYKIYYY